MSYRPDNDSVKTFVTTRVLPYLTAVHQLERDFREGGCTDVPGYSRGLAELAKSDPAVATGIETGRLIRNLPEQERKRVEKFKDSLD